MSNCGKRSLLAESQRLAGPQAHVMQKYILRTSIRFAHFFSQIGVFKCNMELPHLDLEIERYIHFSPLRVPSFPKNYCNGLFLSEAAVFLAYDQGPRVPLGCFIDLPQLLSDPKCYHSLSLAMSTPSNNEPLPKKSFKEKFRSVFSSRSLSRNLDVLDALPSSNIPPIKSSYLSGKARENSPSDGPRIIADRTVSGE